MQIGNSRCGESATPGPKPKGKSGRKPLNLAGLQFGRLTAHREAGRHKNGAVLWECRCSCGAVHTSTGSNLVAGASRSCGCLRTEVVVARSTTHGHAAGGQTRTYTSWCMMMSRCHNKDSKDYPYYGGRGISVCPEWKSFDRFLADMGERPPGKTLDRIDNDGNYEPGNCRWATWSQQMSNRRPWARRKRERADQPSLPLAS